VKKALLLSFLLLLTFPFLYSQPQLFQQPLSPRIANYDIDVRLDAATKKVSGHEVIRWLNTSTDVISELQFHLYLNAFRNNRSTFMKESGGSSRGFRMDKEGWGFIEIQKISLPDGPDLKPWMEFIHPDDNNAEDKTVFRLPLPTSLAPGDSVILKIDFIEKLPEPAFARSGSKGNFYFFGQWFPKAGVYIDGRWNCHQYHANSEFFADYGAYNVKLTVPEKDIVGATGLEYAVKNNGDGTATHSYHAEDVHDFAWTTSPDYIEVKTKEQDVDIRILLQPEHKDQAQRHIDAAKVGVRYFQNWYGDYPFPNLTVVDPRSGGAGGMEYPTLITAGTFYKLPEGLRMVEMVIVHEFGHNYWYHLLGSNEFEESWMDEGINTYSEIQIMDEEYGKSTSMINLLGIKLGDVPYHRASYTTAADLDPTIRKAWEYYSGGSYGANSYSKPGLFLTTIHNYLGKETMLKVMHTYADRWRFKHPKSQDFVNVVNEVSGRNLNWFFDQALYTNATLDYSVDRIVINEVADSRGFDFSWSVDQPDSAKTKESPAGVDSAKVYKSEVSIRRLGAFKFPVKVEVMFEGGVKVREQWDGLELWKKFTYIKPVKVISATVDPDKKIPFDVNLTNNSKTIDPHTLGINKLSVRFLFWVQFFMDQPDIMNLLSLFTSVF